MLALELLLLLFGFVLHEKDERKWGVLVPAFEILLEDFTVVVGWIFPWVSIVTLHPATVFWRAAFPVFLLDFFFSQISFFWLLPGLDDPRAMALRPHGFLDSLSPICECEGGQTILGSATKASTDKTSPDKSSMDNPPMDNPPRH